MSQIIVPDPDSGALSAEVNPVVERAKALIVRTQADDETAQRELLTVARIEKFVVGVFKGPKAVLDKAHSDVCADEKRWLTPIREAKQILFGKHNEYAREQERIAETKAAKLRALALKQEEERKLQDAALAEAAGDHEAAEAIVSEPILPTEIKVEAAITRVEGIGKARSIWGAEVTDAKALIKWVAARIDADPGVAAYLEPAMPALNAIAKAQKSAMRIDGVRAVERPASNVRTK